MRTTLRSPEDVMCLRMNSQSCGVTARDELVETNAKGNKVLRQAELSSELRRRGQANNRH